MRMIEGTYKAVLCKGDWLALIEADESRAYPCKAFVTIEHRPWPRRPTIRRVYASTFYDARPLALRLLRARAVSR